MEGVPNNPPSVGLNVFPAMKGEFPNNPSVGFNVFPKSPVEFPNEGNLSKRLVEFPEKREEELPDKGFEFPNKLVVELIFPKREDLS